MVSALAGCAVGASSFATLPTRAASDVPERFVPAAPPRTDGPVCSSPLLDPRNDFAVVLERSGRVQTSAGSRFDPGAGADPGARLVGDYRVDEGRYGVRDGELLRVDCGTGRPIGIVPR